MISRGYKMIQTKNAPKATQIATIKAHLMAGKSITTWQAYQLYNITSLAQRIHELRNKGLPVDDEMVTKEGKRFKLYWLRPDYISRRVNTSICDRKEVKGEY